MKCFKIELEDIQKNILSNDFTKYPNSEIKITPNTKNIAYGVIRINFKLELMYESECIFRCHIPIKVTIIYGPNNDDILACCTKILEILEIELQKITENKEVSEHRENAINNNMRMNLVNYIKEQLLMLVQTMS